MITTVKFAKLREDAKIPSKRKEDAGYDIYACFDEDFIIIKPHETKIIPTGLCSAFDEDYVLLLHERGSTGTKGLGQRAGVIDSGYRGEIGVPLTNHNKTPLVIVKDNYDKDMLAQKLLSNPKLKIIYPYNKAVCQALLLPVPEVIIEEYTYEEIQAIPSKRGDGKLGSSDK